MTELVLHLPYSARAMSQLRHAEKLGATWSVDINENVTIQCKKNKLKKIKKIFEKVLTK